MRLLRFWGWACPEVVFAGGLGWNEPFFAVLSKEIPPCMGCFPIIGPCRVGPQAHLAGRCLNMSVTSSPCWIYLKDLHASLPATGSNNRVVQTLGRSSQHAVQCCGRGEVATLPVGSKDAALVPFAGWSPFKSKDL